MKGSLKVQSDSNATSNKEPKYMTGTTGVQENPNAHENKEVHVIEPPKHSTQHF